MNEVYDTGIAVGWTNLLEFYGFQSRGMYWGKDDTFERNVFRSVVAACFTTEPGDVLS